MSPNRADSPLKKRRPWQVLILTLLGVILVLVGFLGYPLIQSRQAENPTSPENPTRQTPSPTPTSLASQQVPVEFQEQGFILLSIYKGHASHLFAFQPETFALSRLGQGAWDDISPAISPDGQKMIYTSRKNGYWNLYILDIASGSETRLTDTPAYEGAPSWSPDNQWITYENIADGNLEIYIQNTLDASVAPIRLTQNNTADFSPDWSPQGRVIAYVSTGDQNTDIWLANLDNSGERFVNLTQSQTFNEKHPVWSPDGTSLAWVSDQNGIQQIWVWDTASKPGQARLIGRGDWPAWSPDGQSILAVIQDPNQVFLTAYNLSSGQVILPPVSLPGQVHGLSWKNVAAPQNILALAGAGTTSEAPLYTPALTYAPVAPAGRYGVVPLTDIQAPYPYLHDLVNEAFDALRLEVGHQAGWDLLLSLENAYVPLTYPPSPGIPEDWLYTGRAFAINPQASRSGWMVVAREYYNGESYWRVFIKARYQDGSQGIPLTSILWDLNARYSGNPVAYEQGGAFANIPAEYWVDLTEIAFQYDWQRLPAFSNWRTYYPAARYNQFVLTGGHSWSSAMQELYPPEALVTPTFIPTYTPTPIPPTLTPTRRMISSSTPAPPSSPTPLPAEPTIRPTWTLPPAVNP